MPTSTLAELTGFSNGYISQVKHGKRPPSQDLLEKLSKLVKLKISKIDYLALFMQSRQAMGVSDRTLEFYKDRLTVFVETVDYTKAPKHTIQRYLNQIPPNSNGLATRHASFRAIKTFYRWLNVEFGIKNPIEGMPAPILGKPILPSLAEGQVLRLISEAISIRDKAIIALFTESGLRLSELVNIQLKDINWEQRIVRIWGKGRKQAYAPFGSLTEQYLRQSLDKYPPNGNIWSMSKNGIQTMLQRLEADTGIKCNPHTFRRTFACLLRKAGIDCLTIKDLGRWESLEMVQRYTRSVTFEDSLKHYIAPLS